MMAQVGHQMALDRSLVSQGFELGDQPMPAGYHGWRTGQVSRSLHLAEGEPGDCACRLEAHEICACRTRGWVLEIPRARPRESTIAMIRQEGLCDRLAYTPI